MLWKPYLLSLLLGVVAGSQPLQIVPRAFIVEYEDDAVIQTTKRLSGDFAKYSQQLKSSLDIPGATKTMDLVFDLFKGATYEFDDIKPVGEHVTQLLALPAIKNVWPKKIVPPPNPSISWVAPRAPAGSSSNQMVKRSYSNDTVSTHMQTQVDKLRAKGVTGEGVKIALVDTGIDYTHPALGGCFGPGCLVVGGYDFVGDKYNGSNVPVPDNDPLDCQGHGTHVAGIVAAQPNKLGFTGGAPGVKLAAYRVFGCTGYTANDVLIAAFLRAQQEGANIISASLGEQSGWVEEVMNVVVARIVAQGVSFIASAGNSGDQGLFVESSPAGGKGVASIASYDNILTPVLSVRGHYTVSGSPKQSFEYTVGLPYNWTNVKLPIWAPSFDTNQTDQGCDPFPDSTPDLSSKIVLIRRGTCPWQTKAENAVARGAKYVMLYNNVLEKIAIQVDVQNLTSIGLVAGTLGAAWVRDLAAGKVVTLDMGDPNTSPISVDQNPNNDTGGFLSYYTSWGPSFEANISPTFGVPGGSILSTYPVALGSYAVLSGTSMAAPLTAAIYALLSNVRKTSDPSELRNVLAATAKPVQANPNGTISPFLAPIAQQGAGIIQAFDAAYANTVLSDSSLAFNDTVRLTDKSFTISNTGREAVTYELDVIGAATAYTFSDSKKPDPFPGLELDESFATVHLSEYKVTVPAGGKSKVAVKVTPPSVDVSRLPVYGGYIRVNGTNGERLSLPYQGIAGDLNAHTVLNMTYVSRTSDDPDFAPVSGNSTFLFPRFNITDINKITDDLPIAAIDMYFGSPVLKVEALSTGNYTTNLGQIIDIPNAPFQLISRGLNYFPWNGQLADGSWAPSGSYKFRVSALRIFGNASDAKQWEVAESPSFTIKYKESNVGSASGSGSV